MDALDPQQYVAHVTRTALLLEQLAQDVRTLRDQADSVSRGTESLRGAVTVLDRDFAVYRAGTSSEVAAGKLQVAEIADSLKWLRRLVLGALLTGVVGGVIALIFKMVG